MKCVSLMCHVHDLERLDLFTLKVGAMWVWVSDYSVYFIHLDAVNDFRAKLVLGAVLEEVLFTRIIGTHYLK